MIVSNTTPIICFLKIRRMEILKSIFKEIIIPHAVYKELTMKVEEADEIHTLIGSGLLKVESAKNEFAVNLLQKQVGLDLGESEAIVLAQDLKANTLLIDERKGRKIAEESGIIIAGTLGILVKAKNLGIIAKVKPFLDELINKDIRIGDKLYKQILQYVNEE